MPEATEADKLLHSTFITHGANKHVIEDIGHSLRAINCDAAVVIGIQSILQGIFDQKWAEAVAQSREKFGHSDTDAAIKRFCPK